MSDEKKDPTRPYAEIAIILILSQMFWWFMFAKPFLALFGELVEALKKIAN